jgi:hypothetical protein
VTKPNFFLIGAPKCGTTAVALALGQHPEIFMTEPKEPCYFLFTEGNPYAFDPETRVSRLDDYLALFADSEGKKVRGEASPFYIHASYAAQEMQRFNPEARIMAIVRNPVERAVSMYLAFHQYDRRGEVTPADFKRQFLSGEYCHIPVGKITRRMEFLKSFGFYHALLEPYYERFPADRILVLSYDGLKLDGNAFLERVLAFLEVDSSFRPPVKQANVTFEPRSRELEYWLNLACNSPTRELVKRTLGSSGIAKNIRNSINRLNRRKVGINQFLTKESFRQMIEVYREDIERLSERVGTDFRPWLNRAPVWNSAPPSRLANSAAIPSK